MNRICLLTVVLSGIGLFGGGPANDEVNRPISDKVREMDIFDRKLATKLGADEYGMKKYVLALLREGPNRGQDPSTAANLQRAHLDNIKRLADIGKLSLAGPFLDDGEIKGIYIFNVESIEEAKQLTATDPSIQAGRLVMELHTWYGSAALQQVNELHKNIAKKSH